MKAFFRTLLSVLTAAALLISILSAYPAVAFAVPREVLGDLAKNDRLIVRLKDGAVSPFRMLSAIGVGPTPIPHADGYFVAESFEEIQDWIDAGLVDYVGPDAELELLDDPLMEGLFADDPRMADQWYLDLIDVADAWGRGLTGDGVTVAVIDSGIYREHEDLNYGRITGYSFLGFPENFGSYDDRTGHGTFVTGLMAAEMGNARGIAGISSQVDILSLRCFSNDGVGDYNTGSGMVSTVLSAIGYAMEQNADVINMSFGGTNEALLLPLKEKLEEAAAKGIILVAAAGNSGTDILYYPAAYDCVIGVGMVDGTGTVDAKSQRNESVFITAPGSGVLSLGHMSPQSYSTGTGTSYATPVVSAMAAMVKQANSAIDNEGFEALLRVSSVDRGIEGYDTDYGWGLVNVGNLAEVLFQPFTIIYECNGGNLSGEPGPDYIVSYTVDRTTPAVLPEPERDGRVFAGWFDNAQCSGQRLTVVPQSSVGDLTFYAKWIEESSMALSSVTVLGISAAIDESDSSGMTYLVEVPEGTDLGSITAADIVAVPANGRPAKVSMVPDSQGAAWTVSFPTASDYLVTYLIRIVVSANASPVVADSQDSQTGSATPASYDGRTEAIPYTRDVATWFVDDGETLVYLVSSNTGSGLAEVSGSSITYTPSAADAGKTVAIALRADDGQFRSVGEVTVSIDVTSIPISDSIIEPVAATFDKRTGSDGGIPVTVRLYGNSLVSVQNGDALLTAGTDYTFSSMPAIEGGEGLVSLGSDYLAALEDGSHTIFFNFSHGREEASKTAVFSLTVLDSTPKYTVVFMDGSIEHHRVTEVREGDTVVLPSPPTRSNSTFGGWFTGPNGEGNEVTAGTPITEALGPVSNIITVHAKWTENQSGGSGGTGDGGSGGGGGGSGGNLPVAPPITPAPVQPEPPLVPLWQNPFLDVGPDNWFYSSVEYVCSKGLFEGESADAFCPDATMTRAMLVTVIHRLAGMPQGAGESFEDVPDDSWYGNAVRWAHGEGIVTGFGSQLGPEDSVTREQLVTMLYRYVTVADLSVGEGEDDLAEFVDAEDVSPWARDAMAWAVRVGLIQGKPGRRLDAKGTATRAEVAVIMQRLMQRLASEPI